MPVPELSCQAAMESVEDSGGDGSSKKPTKGPRACGTCALAKCKCEPGSGPLGKCERYVCRSVLINIFLFFSVSHLGHCSGSTAGCLSQTSFFLTPLILLHRRALPYTKVQTGHGCGQQNRAVEIDGRDQAVCCVAAVITLSIFHFMLISAVNADLSPVDLDLTFCASTDSPPLHRYTDANV